MIKNKIDITTTATLRPELLEKTYKSFFTNLFMDKHDYRIIINVDPIGSELYAAKEMVLIAKKFCNNVIYNCPKEANFAKAWKWCWEQVESDFVFHLEEDWELLRKVDINHMIGILNNNLNLAALRMLKINVPKDLWFFRSAYTVEDGFLKAEDRSVSFGGNPQLIKSEFVKQACKYMTIDKNPEKQFRPDSKNLWEKVVSKWDYGVYANPGDKKLIIDIGRQWMENHRFQKKESTTFIIWEKY
jgi:hypothetical protein